MLCFDCCSEFVKVFSLLMTPDNYLLMWQPWFDISFLCHSPVHVFDVGSGLVAHSLV